MIEQIQLFTAAEACVGGNWIDQSRLMLVMSMLSYIEEISSWKDNLCWDHLNLIT